MRRLKFFLAQISGKLPPRIRGILLDFAAIAFLKILKPARKCIAQYSRRLLPIAAERRPPHDLWPTTEDFCRSVDTDVSYYPLHEANDLHREHLPASLNKVVHDSFIRERYHRAPRTFVAELRSARVFGDCGAVITPDGRLASDVSLEISAQGFSHSIFSRILLPRPIILEGTTTVLSTIGRANYFHWMFECLPRLELLRLAGYDWNAIDHFLVGEFTLFQKETLERLGIDPARRVLLETNGHFECKNLRLASLPSATGNPPPWVCDFLRGILLENPDKAEGPYA